MHASLISQAATGRASSSPINGISFSLFLFRGFSARISALAAQKNLTMQKLAACMNMNMQGMPYQSLPLSTNFIYALRLDHFILSNHSTVYFLSCAGNILAVLLRYFHSASDVCPALRSALICRGIFKFACLTCFQVASPALRYKHAEPLQQPRACIACSLSQESSTNLGVCSNFGP